VAAMPLNSTGACSSSSSSGGRGESEQQQNMSDKMAGYDATSCPITLAAQHSTAQHTMHARNCKDATS
jgi:hypothetical protein